MKHTYNVRRMAKNTKTGVTKEPLGLINTISLYKWQ